MYRHRGGNPERGHSYLGKDSSLKNSKVKDTIHDLD
jgi:hypothetical protein